MAGLVAAGSQASASLVGGQGGQRQGIQPGVSGELAPRSTVHIQVHRGRTSLDSHPGAKAPGAGQIGQGAERLGKRGRQVKQAAAFISE